MRRAIEGARQRKKLVAATATSVLVVAFIATTQALAYQHKQNADRLLEQQALKERADVTSGDGGQDRDAFIGLLKSGISAREEALSEYRLSKRYSPFFVKSERLADLDRQVGKWRREVQYQERLHEVYAAYYANDYEAAKSKLYAAIAFAREHDLDQHYGYRVLGEVMKSQAKPLITSGELTSILDVFDKADFLATEERTTILQIAKDLDKYSDAQIARMNDPVIGHYLDALLSNVGHDREGADAMVRLIIRKAKVQGRSLADAYLFETYNYWNQLRDSEARESFKKISTAGSVSEQWASLHQTLEKYYR